MTGWIVAYGPAFAGQGLPEFPDLPASLPHGTLLVEIAPGLFGEEPAHLIAGADKTGARLTLDALRGLWFLEGRSQERPALAIMGPISNQSPEVLRILFSWDTGGSSRRLWIESGEDEALGCATDSFPREWQREDISALFDPGTKPRIHPAVQGFALTSARLSQSPGLGIGAATPVDTPQGRIRASALRLGDLVMTVDHGPQPIRWLRRFNLPSGGSLCPVRIRAPYFGAEADVILAPNQRIRMEGAEVEYLFGEDEVLVQAARLLSSRVAVSERRRPQSEFVTIGFERPEVFLAGGCGLASLPLGHMTRPARRELCRYEVATVLAARDRARNPIAA